MSPMETLLLAILTIPAIGLMVAGVLLIRMRHRFSARGSVAALILGILATSFGVTLALAVTFVWINLGSEAVGGTQEFGIVDAEVVGDAGYPTQPV